MSGIDKILEEIRINSDNIVSGIINKAKTEADNILAQANMEADRESEKLGAQCELECKNIIERAQSSANLIEKKAILRAKQKIIFDTINVAHNNLLSLSDDEYFKLIIKMIEKYSSKDKGQILFNEKDIGRLPLLFSAKILKASKGTLKVGDTPVDIDGGFILSYGNIEENCSFKAIFDANREILQDNVNKLLFE